jgi:FkbM family methyltransferase
VNTLLRSNQQAARRLAKRAVRAAGYAVRDVGRGVGGVDLLHDADVLLGARPGLVVFDIGANIGQTTLAMLEVFQAPRIRSFEPSPATVKTLRRAVEGRSGVSVEAIAFGDAVGRLPFHVTADHSVNDSLLRPRWNDGGTVVEVPVATVDSYCETHGIAQIDLLKIDTQGYDLRVLHGARRMLGDRRVRLFTCEVNQQALYHEQAQLRDLFAFGDEVGYRLVGFYEQSYVNNELSYFDVMFKAG